MLIGGSMGTCSYVLTGTDKGMAGIRLPYCTCCIAVASSPAPVRAWQATRSTLSILRESIAVHDDAYIRDGLSPALVQGHLARIHIHCIVLNIEHCMHIRQRPSGAPATGLLIDTSVASH